MNRLLRDNLMREDSLHRLGAAEHLRNHHISVIGIEPAMIADLAAGVGIKAGVVEHNFGGLARFDFLRAHAILHQRQHFAVGRDELPIAFEDGLRQLAIRRAGGRFRSAFPGSASAGLLFRAGALEAFHVELQCRHRGPHRP